jgi:type II secretory pathway pseudopilin PulG
MELLIVIIVIGILAAIALPNFTPMREKTIEKEAVATLQLLQAAEKIYRMEAGDYYPFFGGGGPSAISDHSQINANLKLMLPLAGPWGYRVKNTGTGPGGNGQCSDAARNGTGPYWSLIITGTSPVTGSCL